MAVFACAANSESAGVVLTLVSHSCSLTTVQLFGHGTGARPLPSPVLTPRGVTASSTRRVFGSAALRWRTMAVTLRAAGCCVTS